MNDGRQSRPGQHAQNGVGEHQQKVLELGNLLQAGHRAAHGFHAEHENGKAQENHANVLFPLFLAHHGQDDADEGQDRGKGAGLEQLDKEIAALQPGEAQDPGGDGGAHVGAHNHPDGLPQREQARVDKAHHHHRGGRGALDHGGDAHTREKAQELAGGQLAQQHFQAAAGGLFQIGAHQIHAEQE